MGGGIALGVSIDIRLFSGGGWLGTGGGTALGGAAVGIGGGRVGGASDLGDSIVLSSTLESLACVLSASLCGAEEAISVS